MHAGEPPEIFSLARTKEEEVRGKRKSSIRCIHKKKFALYIQFPSVRDMNTKIARKPII